MRFEKRIVDEGHFIGFGSRSIDQSNIRCWRGREGATTPIGSVTSSNHKAGSRGGHRIGQELVRFDGVGLTFPGGSARRPVEVIRQLDLRVKVGEFVAVIGPSGCGKSTLLSLLAGYLTPSSGRVLFRGKPISGPGRERMMVFQQPALFPWLTTAENIAYGLKLKANRSDGRNVKETVAAMLQLVQLDGFARHYPSDLSGGMRQRLEIARALAVDPEVLLMDEPLA